VKVRVGGARWGGVDSVADRGGAVRGSHDQQETTRTFCPDEAGLGRESLVKRKAGGNTIQPDGRNDGCIARTNRCFDKSGEQCACACVDVLIGWVGWLAYDEVCLVVCVWLEWACVCLERGHVNGELRWSERV
jgi:hypothetical protein